MKNLIELFEIFPTIEGSTFVMRELNIFDFDDLINVFSDEHTKKFYHLSPEHQDDIDLFIATLAANEYNKSQISWIIAPKNNDEAIGFVTIEFENEGYLLNAKLSYALNVWYRKNGIITEAVNKVVSLLEDFPLASIIAYVELENIPSVQVLKKNGFSTNTTLGFYDQNIEGGALRFKWKKDIIGGRLYLFNLASQVFHNKDYNRAIEIFQGALEQDYIEGSPYTDLQIHSNIGMALISLKKYSEAYKCLMYVQANGLTNPSITRELGWLKTNFPHLL